MKKIVLATALVLAATAASAVEVGVTATRDYSGDNRNFGGITIGEKFGPLGITGGFERSTAGSDNQDRYSLVAGYDVTKLGSVTVTPRLGVAFLDNQTSSNGYAMTVGIGASVPVAKKVSVGLALDRQYGQDRVDQFNGNRITAAAKYSF
jgi:opacity protein-like surface antigen